MYCDKVIEDIADYVPDYSARGIAAGVSAAIREGVLRPGAKLPPIRAVASEFQCSPTTVNAAWAILARAGLIHSDRRRGTVVVPQQRSGRGRYRRALENTTVLHLDLATGVPDPALLPDLQGTLARLDLHRAAANYLTDPVVPELAEHLRDTWPFAPELVTITDGAMDALDLIISTHLSYGDRVLVENPCFPPLLDLLETMGCRVIPLELDDRGCLPDQLAAALKAGPRAVFIQPRAQNPTGVSMNHERASELTKIISHHDVIVVENDSAGEIASTPLYSLGADLPNHTIHVRSFSKSHGPDLRLAAIGGATDLIEPIINRRFRGQSWTSHLLQRILLDFLTHDEPVQQVATAREAYARRRRSLINALSDRGITAEGTDGFNVWVPVADEPSALISLTRCGIGVAPGSAFNAGRGPTRHVRVTSASLDHETSAVADALAEAAGR